MSTIPVDWKNLAVFCFLLCVCFPLQLMAQQKQVLIVVGAAGEPEYEAMFRSWVDRWEQAAAAAGNSFHVIGIDGAAPSEVSTTEQSDRDQLEKWLQDWKRVTIEQTNRDTTDRQLPDRQLWLVLVGHGTFDGKVAKFNLRGADIAASDLKKWLEDPNTDSKSIDQIVINCSSSSGPFLNQLSAPNRIVVTATQSGSQFNFTRFGDFLSQQVVQNKIDLDKDKRTSLLELVLAASSDTVAYYDNDKRLATEMATIEDNADGLGTPAEWFKGLRVTKIAKDHAPDGLRSNQVFFANAAPSLALTAEQRLEVERLELALEDLRRMKGSLEETLYFERLEELAVKIAQIYNDK